MRLNMIWRIVQIEEGVIYRGRKTSWINSLRDQGIKIKFIICNNTKDYFWWDPEKINVKFHKNCENTGKFLKISCGRSNFVKFCLFLRLFCSGLVSYSAISSSDNLFFHFTYAKTARLPRCCRQIRLRLCIGEIYHQIDSIFSKYGKPRLAMKISRGIWTNQTENGEIFEWTIIFQAS